MGIFTAGFVGVGVFFILSRFLLVYHYHAEDFQARGRRKQFWVSGLARI